MRLRKKFDHTNNSPRRYSIESPAQSKTNPNFFFSASPIYLIFFIRFRRINKVQVQSQYFHQKVGENFKFSDNPDIDELSMAVEVVESCNFSILLTKRRSPVMRVQRCELSKHLRNCWQLLETKKKCYNFDSSIRSHLVLHHLPISSLHTVQTRFHVDNGSQQHQEISEKFSPLLPLELIWTGVTFNIFIARHQ